MSGNRLTSTKIKQLEYITCHKPVLGGPLKGGIPEGGTGGGIMGGAADVWGGTGAPIGGGTGGGRADVVVAATGGGPADIKWIYIGVSEKKLYSHMKIQTSRFSALNLILRKKKKKKKMLD